MSMSVAKEKKEFFIKPLSVEILQSFISTLQQLPETTKLSPYLQCPHMVPEFEASSNVLIGYRPMITVMGAETKTLQIGQQTVKLEGCIYKCTVCNDKFWWLSPKELGYKDGMTPAEIEATVHRTSIEAMKNISFLFSSMLHQEKLTRGTKEINHPSVANFTGSQFLTSLADTSVGPQSGGVKRLNGVIMMLTVEAYVRAFSAMADVLNGKAVNTTSDLMDVMAVKPMVGDMVSVQSVNFQANPTQSVKPISNYGFAIADVTPTLINPGKVGFQNGQVVSAPGVSGGVVPGMPPVAGSNIAE